MQASWHLLLVLMMVLLLVLVLDDGTGAGVGAGGGGCWAGVAGVCVLVWPGVPVLGVVVGGAGVCHTRPDENPLLGHCRLRLCEQVDVPPVSN